ncbi:hypothetical protein KC19_9G017900 [Ceratodon purpureus]|uniref:Uncharacterized protein n=1 Tax=Ceratodon purpureus TaxID=3225 RepID=A0A8T0GMS5_CERPU|nr:hypothetical protein KC19_9G017900 [Ceratodon purpureus]
MAPRSNRRAGMEGASSTDAMDVKGEVVAASRISVKVKDDSGAIKKIVVKTANGESITYVVENPGPRSPPPRMPVCRGQKCRREFRSDDEFYCAHCGLHRPEFSDRIFECRDKMCTKCGEKRGRGRQEFARFVEKVLKDHAGDLPAGEFTLEEDHVKQKVQTIIKGNYDNFKQEMERVGMHLIDQEAIFDYVRSRKNISARKRKKEQHLEVT